MVYRPEWAEKSRISEIWPEGDRGELVGGAADASSGGGRRLIGFALSIDWAKSACHAGRFAVSFARDALSSGD
jgi:hypothetical protein